jgi:hypothetical protein
VSTSRIALFNSPLLSWLHGVFGLRGTSALFGIFEVAAGALIGARAWLPRASGYAGLVLEPRNPMSGFLMKDIVLLGAAVFTAAEALGAAGIRGLTI